MLFVTTANDGDGEVSIAMVVDGDHLAAYACADDVTADPYPGWFIGDVSPDGSFSVSLSGWSFSGVVDGNAAHGTILEPDGTTVSWSSALGAHSPVTGLYTSNTTNSECSAGVIVIADDPARAPVVRGAWCNVMQVTPVAPVALVDGRLAVDVASRSPWRLYVTPVRAAPPQ
jgi:hypothetical protein